ncbi:hypothetical protein AX14_006732 [Amanita brunnescens Koide BX004]|nr:hypothetical protein AX14_006732 [Amanita brunnescens Koide BX004]
MRMPLRTSQDVPRFLGTADDLPRYFVEVEALCRSCHRSADSKVIRYAVYYTDESSWDAFAAARDSLEGPKTWQEFKTVIFEFYPQCEVAHMHTSLPASLPSPPMPAVSLPSLPPAAPMTPTIPAKSLSSASDVQSLQPAPLNLPLLAEPLPDGVALSPTPSPVRVPPVLITATFLMLFFSPVPTAPVCQAPHASAALPFPPAESALSPAPALPVPQPALTTSTPLTTTSLPRNPLAAIATLAPLRPHPPAPSIPPIVLAIPILPTHVQAPSVQPLPLPDELQPQPDDSAPRRLREGPVATPVVTRAAAVSPLIPALADHSRSAKSLVPVPAADLLTAALVLDPDALQALLTPHVSSPLPAIPEVVASAPRFSADICPSCAPASPVFGFASAGHAVCLDPANDRPRSAVSCPHQLVAAICSVPFAAAQLRLALVPAAAARQRCNSVTAGGRSPGPCCHTCHNWPAYTIACRPVPFASAQPHSAPTTAAHARQPTTNALRQVRLYATRRVKSGTRHCTHHARPNRPTVSRFNWSATHSCCSPALACPDPAATPATQTG